MLVSEPTKNLALEGALHVDSDAGDVLELESAFAISMSYTDTEFHSRRRASPGQRVGSIEGDIEMAGMGDSPLHGAVDMCVCLIRPDVVEISSLAHPPIPKSGHCCCGSTCSPR